MMITQEIIDRILLIYEVSKLRVQMAKNKAEIENVWELGEYLYNLDQNKDLNLSNLSKRLLKEDPNWDFEVDRLSVFKDFYAVYKDLDILNSLLTSVDMYSHQIILTRCKTNIERMFYLSDIRTKTDGTTMLGRAIRKQKFEKAIFNDLKTEITISNPSEFTSWFNNLSGENKLKIEVKIRQHFEILTDTELYTSQ